MDNYSYTKAPQIKSGYDLPVYGLENGMFYVLHVPAVVCTFISLCCVLATIILSFRRHTAKPFFSWSKCDRFVIYLALCDGLFNLSHICDHLQMTLTKDHVYPRELCQAYAFLLSWFISAQTLMVNIIAFNIFLLMYFNKQPKFGKYDWKLLTWTFGTPLCTAVTAAALGQFGSSTAFCYFDAVKGTIGNICLTTAPMGLILLANIILYTLTLTKIIRETKQIRSTLGQNMCTRNRSLSAARSMSLFVAAFFIQWCVAGIYGSWGIFGEVPIPVFHAVTILSNIGGFLNFMVYLILHRKRHGNPKQTISSIHSTQQTR